MALDGHNFLQKHCKFVKNYFYALKAKKKLFRDWFRVKYQTFCENAQILKVDGKWMSGGLRSDPFVNFECPSKSDSPTAKCFFNTKKDPS